MVEMVHFMLFALDHNFFLNCQIKWYRLERSGRFPGEGLERVWEWNRTGFPYTEESNSERGSHRNQQANALGADAEIYGFQRTTEGSEGCRLRV